MSNRYKKMTKEKMPLNKIYLQHHNISARFKLNTLSIF